MIEMDASSCGSSKRLDNAKKLHPSSSSEGFVDEESSVEVKWKQHSIDYDPRNSSNYEMETYFLKLV
jgi:hypothetical protein